MIELKDRRARNAKHYQTDDGRLIAEIYGGRTVLTYADVNTGQREDVDFELKRVNNAQLDGWIVTGAGFRYWLGQPAGELDGWVGFGPKRGQDIWFKYRLARAIYYHPASDTFETLATADYDRSKLSKEDRIFTGLDGTRIKIATEAEWRSVMPGLDINWRIDGNGVKEDLILGENAFKNLPSPGTGNEFDNFFGFAFEVDVDGLKVRHGDQDVDPEAPYDANDGRIDFTDTINTLLAHMPSDYVKTTGGSSTDDGQTEQVKLKKRFVQAGGKSYLLIGAKLADLQALPAGDLIFDPTIEIQPDGASGKDTWIEEIKRADNNFGSSAGFHVNYGNSATYGRRHAFIEFDLTSIPSGSRCNSAEFTVTNYRNGAGAATIYAYPMLFEWEELEMTWYEYETGGTWPGSPGGSTPDIDFDSNHIGVFTGPSKVQTPVTASLDTQYFEDRFGSSPAKHNHGFTLRSYDKYNNLWSSDASSAERRPKLVIEYEEAIADAIQVTAEAVEPIRPVTACVSFAGAIVDIVDLPPIPITAHGAKYWETKNAAVSVLLLMVSGGSEWVAVDSVDAVLTYSLKVERRKGYQLPE